MSRGRRGFGSLVLDRNESSWASRAGSIAGPGVKRKARERRRSAEKRTKRRLEIETNEGHLFGDDS